MAWTYNWDWINNLKKNQKYKTRIKTSHLPLLNSWKKLSEIVYLWINSVQLAILWYPGRQNIYKKDKVQPNIPDDYQCNIFNKMPANQIKWYIEGIIHNLFYRGLSLYERMTHHMKWIKTVSTPCLENEKWNLYVHLLDAGLKNLINANNKSTQLIISGRKLCWHTKTTYENLLLTSYSYSMV